MYVCWGSGIFWVSCIDKARDYKLCSLVCGLTVRLYPRVFGWPADVSERLDRADFLLRCSRELGDLLGMEYF
jgi:hypothetical protein